jgi:hypothetical protein
VKGEDPLQTFFMVARATRQIEFLIIFTFLLSSLFLLIGVGGPAAGALIEAQISRKNFRP